MKYLLFFHSNSDCTNARPLNVTLYVHCVACVYCGRAEGFGRRAYEDDNDDNNNNNNLLQLGCHPVAVVILHVHKIWNRLLLNLSLEGYMRSM